MMADPLTKLHCCIRTDGGGAVVLTSEERARDLAEAAGVGARHRRGDVAHDDERVGRLHRVARGAQRAARVRARRRHARRHRHLPDLRRVHADGAADVRGARLLQEGRRRPVRRGRQAAPRRRAARPTPTAAGSRTATRACAACSCSSRRRASSAARRTAARSRTRKLACVNGTGGWFSSASTTSSGVD